VELANFYIGRQLTDVNGKCWLQEEWAKNQSPFSTSKQNAEDGASCNRTGRLC
jgi:hypothetical protein